MRVVEGGLDDRRVVEMLTRHLTRCRAETAPGSAHALDVSGLRAADIRLWTVWSDDDLLGCGALRLISRDLGEVKSMHTTEAARRRGVGALVLRTILDASRNAGLRRLSLETGSWDYFAPARAFYLAQGFTPCEPFEGYEADANSVFMTVEL